MALWLSQWWQWLFSATSRPATCAGLTSHQGICLTCLCGPWSPAHCTSRTEHSISVKWTKFISLGNFHTYSHPSKWRQLCFIISGLRYTQITPIGLGYSHISCHIFRYIGWFQVADLILILLVFLRITPSEKTGSHLKARDVSLAWDLPVNLQHGSISSLLLWSSWVWPRVASRSSSTKSPLVVTWMFWTMSLVGAKG